MNLQVSNIVLKHSPLSRLQKLLRNSMLKRMSDIRFGHITIIDSDGQYYELGSTDHPLSVVVNINEPKFYEYLARSGTVGAGESYMAGHWRCSDLVTLIRILVLNRTQMDALESGFARIGGQLLNLLHKLRRNSISGARRNIAAHYDLSNELFAIFLDQRLMYSSAIYQSESDSIDRAQEYKLQQICKKLKLQASDHLIEIGSGWGGMAIYAAKNYGCKVTTITISKEQCSYAKKLVAEHGLSDQVEVLLKDYRELNGQFDKLVSIEMIEAVGHQYLDKYLSQCCKLLKPDGLALIQAITIEDYRYQQALKSVDFIKQFIFPGSFIPSISAITQSMATSSDFRLVGMQEIGDSYALTLRAWRTKFLSQIAQIKRLGFDQQFINMWEFYLAYCEGGFMERSIGTAQLLLARPLNRTDTIVK